MDREKVKARHDRLQRQIAAQPGFDALILRWHELFGRQPMRDVSVEAESSVARTMRLDSHLDFRDPSGKPWLGLQGVAPVDDSAALFDQCIQTLGGRPYYFWSWEAPGIGLVELPDGFADWCVRFMDDDNMWVFFRQDLQACLVVDRASAADLSVDPPPSVESDGEEHCFVAWVGYRFEPPVRR